MSDHHLDGADRRILAELQDDGRLSNVELAERVKLTPSPCLRRLRALEQSQMIEGYAAILNRPNVGLGLTVFVDIKVHPHTKETASHLQQSLREMPEVVSCYLISGEADYRLEVVVPDLKAYEKFNTDTLLTLCCLQEVRSSFVIRTIKDNSPLPLGHLAGGAP